MTPDKKPSVMRHIRISNIQAESRSIIPSIIAGLEDSFIEDTKISDVRIAIPIAVSVDSLKTYPAIIPENIKGYPENRMTFGLKIPASAFYVKHVKGLTINDLSITYKETDARLAFYLDNVKGIRLKSIFIDDKKLLNNETMLIEKKSEGVEVID